MEFLTGFNEKSTICGFKIENSHFSLIYNGVINIGGETNIVFENGYNWSEVMGILLNIGDGKELARSNVANKVTDTRYEELEYILTLDLARWLCTFQGWGIMWNIIRPDYQHFFSQIFMEVNEEMEAEGDYPSEKVFNEVIKRFKSESCLDLSDIMPPISITISDMEEDFEKTDHNRRKL